MKYLLIIVLFLASCTDDECYFTFKVKSETYKKSTRGEAIFRNGYTQVLDEKYYEHHGQKVEIQDTVVIIKLYNGSRIMFQDSYHVKCGQTIEK